MRRDLIDKVQQVMDSSELFKKNSIYPRRYFDDLVIETKVEQDRIKKQEAMGHLLKGTFDTEKLRNSVSTTQKPNPFHDISGRQPDKADTFP